MSIDDVRNKRREVQKALKPSTGPKVARNALKAVAAARPQGTPSARSPFLRVDGFTSKGSSAPASNRPVVAPEPHFDGELVPLVGTKYDAATEAQAIEDCFKIDNHWSALRSVVTPEFVAHIRAQARIASPETADAIMVELFRAGLQTLRSRSPDVERFVNEIESDWVDSGGAWAYVYPQHFDDLRRMLPYWEQLGIKGVELLPHLKSGGGDGGYDIVDHKTVAAEYGGNLAFGRFMADARQRGLAVITDFVVNHVSDQHPKFKNVLAAADTPADDPNFPDVLANATNAAEWFVHLDDAEKIGEAPDPEGRGVVNRLRHRDGTESRPWNIFPFASDDGLRKVLVGDKLYKFFHFFFPFQPDLNLKNPEVFRYLLEAMGWHANQGVVGQRLDAIPHVAKVAGTSFEDLPETYAWQALIAGFWRMVQPKGIILSEVARSFDFSATYFGDPIPNAVPPRNTGGDVLFAFELGAAYRIALLAEDARALHAMNQNLASLPDNTRWALWLGGNHDELRWDLIANRLEQLGDYTPQQIRALRQTIVDRGGEDFGGRGFGIRHANMLKRDPHHIAMSFVLVEAGTSAIPLMYGGDEIGAENDEEFAKAAEAKRQKLADQNGDDIGLTSARDARDLQRGPLKYEDYQRALNDGYEPLRVFTKLNELRSECPALGGRRLAPLATHNRGIYAVARSTSDAADKPVLVVANLTASRQTMRIPIGEARQKLGWESVTKKIPDLLGTKLAGEPTLVPVRVQDDMLEIELGPHDYHILE